jgi:hypothetical protein
MKTISLLIVWLITTGVSSAHAEETNIIASPCNAKISIRQSQPKPLKPITRSLNHQGEESVNELALPRFCLVTTFGMT